MDDENKLIAGSIGGVLFLIALAIAAFTYNAHSKMQAYNSMIARGMSPQQASCAIWSDESNAKNCIVAAIEATKKNP